MSSASDPQLAVIYPIVDVSGRAADRVRTWTQGQTLPRVLLTPAGTRIDLRDEGAGVVELAEQGFYELRAQAAGGGPAATVAANVDLSESDLTAMDPREVVAAASGRPLDGGEGTQTAEMTDATREATQRVWLYMLFAAAIFLAAETVVSNRVTK